MDCPTCYRTPRSPNEWLNHMPTCPSWPGYPDE